MPEEIKAEKEKENSTKFVLMPSAKKSESPPKSDSEALAKTRAELAIINTSEPTPVLSAPIASSAPSA